MCELLALSTSQPARLTFSLHTLAAHGGEAGNIHDGWGVAFYQGEDVALFREPVAAAGSPLVRYLETQGPSTSLAISHIRHATRCEGRCSSRTLSRSCANSVAACMVFAHNGDLPGIEGSAVLATGPYRPIGQTDSERAFCALLARMRTLWEEAELSSLEARMSLLASFAVDLRTLGPANFLYADGDALFAHGHRRRQRAGGRAEPPGLWVLQRHCAPTDPSPDHRAGVSIDHAEQVALLVASVPLTDEAWRPLSEGELVAVRAGDVLATRFPAAA